MLLAARDFPGTYPALAPEAGFGLSWLEKLWDPARKVLYRRNATSCSGSRRAAAAGMAISAPGGRSCGCCLRQGSHARGRFTGTAPGQFRRVPELTGARRWRS